MRRGGYPPICVDRPDGPRAVNIVSYYERLGANRRNGTLLFLLYTAISDLSSQCRGEHCSPACNIYHRIPSEGRACLQPANGAAGGGCKERASNARPYIISFLATIFLIVILKKFPLRTAQGLTEAGQLKVGDNPFVVLDIADGLLVNIRAQYLHLCRQLTLGDITADTHEL